MLGEGKHPVDTGRVAEGDESKASRPPGGRVLHHHHLGHVAKLGEILPNVLWCCLPREPADEHLSRIVRNLVQVDGSEGGEHA